MNGPSFTRGSGGRSGQRSHHFDRTRPVPEWLVEYLTQDSDADSHHRRR